MSLLITREKLKDQARRLRKLLRTGGVDIRHCQALEAVSVVHGLPNWNRACAIAKVQQSKGGIFTKGVQKPVLVRVKRPRASQVFTEAGCQLRLQL